MKKCPWFPPAYHLPSFSLHMWLHEVFPVTTQQEKRKAQICFTDGFVLYTGTTWKWTTKSLCPFSGTSLNDNGKPGTSVRGIAPSGASLCSFSLEKWMDKHASIYWFMDFDQWFCWIVTDFETTWLDNWWQRFLEKRCVDWCFLIG